MGNRFRYELIEPFFETLEKPFEKRLKQLIKSFKHLMEQSQRKAYLKRVTVKSAFMPDKKSVKILEKLFDDIEIIIPELSQAMNDADENKILLALKKWRQNNTDFMKIAAKRYLELMLSV